MKKIKFILPALIASIVLSGCNLNLKTYKKETTKSQTETSTSINLQQDNSQNYFYGVESLLNKKGTSLHVPQESLINNSVFVDLKKHTLPLEEVYSFVINHNRNKLAYIKLKTDNREPEIVIYNLRNKQKNTSTAKNVPANYVKKFTKDDKFLVTGMYFRGGSANYNCIVDSKTLKNIGCSQNPEIEPPIYKGKYIILKKDCTIKWGPGTLCTKITIKNINNKSEKVLIGAKKDKQASYSLKNFNGETVSVLEQNYSTFKDGRVKNITSTSSIKINLKDQNLPQ